MQTSLGEAGWTEEQYEKDRESTGAKIQALRRDVGLAQNEISAIQAHTLPFLELLMEIAQSCMQEAD